MTEFDPEKFEDKYQHYFPELQRAYKRAFETMNDAYDSELVHAIDQEILAESEPFYEGSAERSSADDSSGQRGGSTASNGTAEPSPGPREHDGEFRVELPDDPESRLQGVVVDEEKLAATLDRYVAEIEAELRAVFGFEEA